MNLYLLHVNHSPNNKGQKHPYPRAGAAALKMDELMDAIDLLRPVLHHQKRTQEEKGVGKAAAGGDRIQHVPYPPDPPPLTASLPPLCLTSCPTPVSPHVPPLLRTCCSRRANGTCRKALVFLQASWQLANQHAAGKHFTELSWRQPAADHIFCCQTGLGYKPHLTDEHKLYHFLPAPLEDQIVDTAAAKLGATRNELRYSCRQPIQTIILL